MTRIVFLDRDTIAPQITVPRPRFDHVWAEYPQTGPAEVAQRVAEAEVVITNKVRIQASDLDAAPNLRLVAVAATGYDCVDVSACQARGVAVCNIRGYSVNTVPEHVFALLLALRRALIPYANEVLDGAWQRAGQFCFFSHPIRDLSGKTMGIVGKGAIGTKVATLAEAFGMEVIFAGLPGTPARAGRVPFEAFLARADVISLHCPLTETTRGLFGADTFAKLTRQPILINTARGALVDPVALHSALDAGQLSGAGLDVADREPPTADDPILSLAAHPRAIVTPHVAWASDEAQQALADQLRDVLEAFDAGTPINLLTKGMTHV